MDFTKVRETLPTQIKATITNLSSPLEGGNAIRDTITTNPKVFDLDRMRIIVHEWETMQLNNKIDENSELYKIAMMFKSSIHNSMSRITMMREIAIECYRASAIIYYNEMLRFQRMHADASMELKKFKEPKPAIDTAAIQQALDNTYAAAKIAAANNSLKKEPIQPQAPPAAKPKNITVINGGKHEEIASDVWGDIEKMNMEKFPKFFGDK